MNLELALQNTLIVRPGALGDAALTLPVLRALRLSGAMRLTVLGAPASWAFLKPSSHSLKKARNASGSSTDGDANAALLQQTDNLRILNFSSIDWMGLVSESVPLSLVAQENLADIHTAIIYLKNANITARVLKKAGIQTIICGEPPTSDAREQHTHAARCLLAPLREFIAESVLNEALMVSDQAADEFLAVEECERIAALNNLGLRAPPMGGFFGAHPGSGGRHKRWPAENFARVTAELASRGYSPLVFFGPSDDVARQEFEAALPRGIEWTLVANRSLREVLALLTLCRGYIGNDSGLTHLAARVCPVVALFGPTAPEIWAPLGKNTRILQAPEKNMSKLEVAAALDAMFNVQGSMFKVQGSRFNV